MSVAWLASYERRAGGSTATDSIAHCLQSLTSAARKETTLSVVNEKPQMLSGYLISLSYATLASLVSASEPSVLRALCTCQKLRVSVRRKHPESNSVFDNDPFRCEPNPAMRSSQDKVDLR